MNVVITGTGSGLGSELFTTFVRESGATVVGSTFPTTRSVAESDYAPNLDLRSDTSVIEYADNVLHQLGHVDILINNAGINGIRHFQELTPEFIRTMMAVNFIGPVMLTRYLLPSMPRGSKIVNIVSDAAHRPMRHSLAYNCSKAALDMATKQMARELTKPHGVSVIGIRPGRMHGTNMSLYIDAQVCAMRSWTMEQTSSYFQANSVTGEEAWPADVARVIHDLVTSNLSPNLSGACIDLVG